MGMVTAGMTYPNSLLQEQRHANLIITSNPACGHLQQFGPCARRLQSRRQRQHNRYQHDGARVEGHQLDRVVDQHHHRHFRFDKHARRNDR